jgi:hypothetical protein
VSGSLPPAATRRLARFAASTSNTSLLSVPAATGLAAVGLEPVGEALGCTVVALSTMVGGGCGGFGSGDRPPVRLSGNRWSGYHSYLQASRSGYDAALRRLVGEAAALGADGVVGIDLRVAELGGGLREFIALGTAVRARSPIRPARPFTTDLSGTAVAQLMLGGWVPVSLHVAMEIGLRHNDLLTMQQASRLRSNRANVEVEGWTELQLRVVSSVRTKLRVRVGASGADGGLLSGLETSHWPTMCGTGGSDHIVQAVASGTSIARFASPRTLPPTLTVLPLHTRGSR